MRTYVSLLRGINVGGKRKILMSDLGSIYLELGFAEIRIYIQSGNVIFETAENRTAEEIASEIELAIKKKYDFDISAILRTSEEMQEILSLNPFLKDSEIDAEKLHLTLLNVFPDNAALSSLQKYDYPPDRFVIIGRNIFLHCPNGYGNTKLSNSFFERKLKVKASTRNWRTVNKLAEMSH